MLRPAELDGEQTQPASVIQCPSRVPVSFIPRRVWPMQLTRHGHEMAVGFPCCRETREKRPSGLAGQGEAPTLLTHR